jgi:predicted CoA-substrate-specific enzyme activase
MNETDGKSIGIDLGSRMTKIVRFVDGEVADAMVFDTGHDALREVLSAIEGLEADRVVATGYGRRLVQESLGCEVVTEIRACAAGARNVCPDCDSALDIGGQDSKAVEIRAGGSFGRFEMNDRCAAGTGRFLEVMAKALGYSIETFGAEAMAADRPAEINSMCTVFAESEVVSLIAHGEDRRRIALGLHIATARRVAAMASRVNPGRKMLFVGGVAQNPCMVDVLRQELEPEIVVPRRPELIVALGAALVGLQGSGG